MHVDLCYQPLYPDIPIGQFHGHFHFKGQLHGAQNKASHNHIWVRLAT